MSDILQSIALLVLSVSLCVSLAAIRKLAARVGFLEIREHVKESLENETDKKLFELLKRSHAHENLIKELYDRFCPEGYSGGPRWSE